MRLGVRNAVLAGPGGVLWLPLGMGGEPQGLGDRETEDALTPLSDFEV